MTAKKSGENCTITEMNRPDGNFQLLVFASNGDPVRFHVDATRDACIAALERDGFVITQ